MKNLMFLKVKRKPLMDMEYNATASQLLDAAIRFGIFESATKFTAKTVCKFNAETKEWQRENITGAVTIVNGAEIERVYFENGKIRYSVILCRCFDHDEAERVLGEYFDSPWEKD